jgi:plastocyanin
MAAAVLALFAAPAIAAGKHTVRIEGMQFAPATLTVKRGEQVVWVNQDLVPHTATAPKAFDSRSIAPGASWKMTAKKPGRYEYVCSFHPTMKATLVVE